MLPKLREMTASKRWMFPTHFPTANKSHVGGLDGSRFPDHVDNVCDLGPRKMRAPRDPALTRGHKAVEAKDGA